MAARKGKKRKPGFFSHLFIILNLGAVLTLLLSYAAFHINPEHFWPLIFFGMAYPALVVINALFIMFWLVRRRWWFLASLLAIFAGYNHLRAYYRIIGNDQVPLGSKSLKVMSYNVRYFDRYSWVHEENTKTRNKIFDLIASESPDIVCFQEFYNDKSAVFSTVDSLKGPLGYPYCHTAYALVKSNQQSYGIATFSRFPIIKRDAYSFSNNIYNFATLTDIVVEDDTFRVFNIHFESIRLSEEDRMFINDLSRQVDNQDVTMEKYKRIFQKIKFAAVLRSTQAKEIRSMIADSPYPVIVCTDMNDIPLSYAYKQLTTHMKDAFAESGKGLGNSYIGFLPAFRIDYIFYDPFFESRAYRTLPDKLSDHYPILTHLIY